MGRTFDELVQKTRGLQPWRRVFHACNGLSLSAILLFGPRESWPLLLALSGLLMVLVVVDWVRLNVQEANNLFFRTFLPLASPREAGKVASSTWYVLGVTLTLLLFPRGPALAGILVLALADPAASVLGRALGTRPFGQGTVEGSLAFLVVATLALLPLFSWPVALGAALAATLVEAIPWPVDDNLAIPLATGLALFLLT